MPEELNGHSDSRPRRPAEQTERTRPRPPLSHQAADTRERIVRSVGPSENRGQITVITSSAELEGLIQEHQLNGSTAIFIRGIQNILLVSEIILSETKIRFARKTRETALKKGFQWTNKTMAIVLSPDLEQSRGLGDTAQQLLTLSNIVLSPGSDDSMSYKESSLVRDTTNELVHNIKDLQQEKVVQALSEQIGAEDTKALIEIETLLKSGIGIFDLILLRDGGMSTEVKEYEAKLEKAKQRALRIITFILTKAPLQKNHVFWRQTNVEIGKIAQVL